MRRILFFSFHYPPDQSAGAVRTQALVKELTQQDPDAELTVFCSVPRRYGQGSASRYTNTPQNQRIQIRRFWIPFLGQGPLASVVSYGFYFAQAVPAAIWLRPQIMVGTSAKLLTSFVAACAARCTGARLYIDFRDTFADNFFYFYRWHKRILLQSLIMAIENLVLRCAHSINMVSIGFKEAFVGWERILAKYSISLTNFPNGIDREFRLYIENSTEHVQSSNDLYRIAYAGNLGEGQDILGLLSDLASRPDLQDSMRQRRLRFDIFGSGSQVAAIKSLTAGQSGNDASGPLAGLVYYRGLISRQDVGLIYSNADCLMLQLGLYSSLSMVIPSKVFEYAATPYPILFGASGFTSTFIDQISGTVGFEQCNAESFLDAVDRARQTTVNQDLRRHFLDGYDAHAIYSAYARHILSSTHKCMPSSPDSAVNPLVEATS
jgi:hypothetical protein